MSVRVAIARQAGSMWVNGVVGATEQMTRVATSPQRTRSQRRILKLCADSGR